MTHFTLPCTWAVSPPSLRLPIPPRWIDNNHITDILPMTAKQSNCFFLFYKCFHTDCLYALRDASSIVEKNTTNIETQININVSGNNNILETSTLGTTYPCSPYRRPQLLLSK